MFLIEYKIIFGNEIEFIDFYLKIKIPHPSKLIKGRETKNKLFILYTYIYTCIYIFLIIKIKIKIFVLKKKMSDLSFRVKRQSYVMRDYYISLL